MKRQFLALIAASVVAVSPFPAALNASPAMQAEMTPEQRRPYVRMAAASDLYEIQSAEIALRKSQNRQVRAFAQMLNRHHRQTTRQLMAAARAARMSPPAPALMPMQADMIRDLRQARGRAFDDLFIKQQVTAHEMALSLHRNYAASGDTPALRKTAQAAVPIIQQHLSRAQQLD